LRQDSFFPGDVAQLVEQRTENPCVGGSIPSITTPDRPLNLRGFFYYFRPNFNDFDDTSPRFKRYFFNFIVTDRGKNITPDARVIGVGQTTTKPFT
jgi:hypothetical protein